MARLRDRLGEAEAARADLIAFARGHAGATAAIHEAVLALMAAPTLEDSFAVVTRDWPGLLGIDCATIALVVGDKAFRVDPSGTFALEREWVARAHERAAPVLLRSGGQGDPLFGPDAASIASEASIRIGQRGCGTPFGVLLIGERAGRDLAAGEGEALLAFLGRSLDAIISRWLRGTD